MLRQAGFWRQPGLQKVSGEWTMSRLFWYECKKLVSRRMVWVSMVVSLLLCTITVCSPLIGSYLRTLPGTKMVELFTFLCYNFST